jgi:hypothetical protein
MTNPIEYVNEETNKALIKLKDIDIIIEDINEKVVTVFIRNKKELKAAIEVSK